MHPESLFIYHKIKKSSKEGNYTATLHLYDTLYLEKRNSSAGLLALKAAKPRGTGWPLFLSPRFSRCKQRIFPKHCLFKTSQQELGGDLFCHSLKLMKGSANNASHRQRVVTLIHFSPPTLV